MKRIQLATARARKHWTLEEAAERLFVDVNTLSRWERGRATPRSYNVARLCEVYGATAADLDLGDASTTETAPSPLLVLATPEDSADDAVIKHLIQQNLALRLVNILSNWPRGDTHYVELQRLIIQETEGDDNMNQKNTSALSRRDALLHLALVPIEFCGLSVLGGVLKSPIEDILTRCAAGIVACEKLGKGQHEDIALASSVLATYLPALQTIVKEAPRYRPQAARLAAQSLLLKATLSVHTQGARSAAYVGEQAVLYSQESTDLSLQLIILKRLAWIYSCDKQPKQALEKVLQAEHLLSHTNTPVTPLIQSDVYGGVAKYHAQNRHDDEALFALRQTHETFFTHSTNDGSSNYGDYNRSNLILEDGLTRYHLGRYEDAFQSYAQAIDPETLVCTIPPSSERVRVEILNHLTLASLKKPKKDMELSVNLWKAGIQGAKALQSKQRFAEAEHAFEMIECLWSNEKGIDDLRDLLKH